jgi:hypothetical protein
MSVLGILRSPPFDQTSQLDSTFHKRTHHFSPSTFGRTEFRTTVPFLGTSARPFVVTSLADQSTSEDGLRIGLIVGVLIGTAVVVGAIVVVLIFVKKVRMAPQSNEDDISPSDLQFVSHSSETTIDEGLVSYHDSFTYEGAPTPERSFAATPIVTQRLF